jgi:hypothetical protein
MDIFVLWFTQRVWSAMQQAIKPKPKNWQGKRMFHYETFAVLTQQTALNFVSAGTTAITKR